MGFKQTVPHRFGKGSYHQIGLVRGQFGNVPMAQWLKFIQDTGFDGWEEASWELELDKCATDQGAEAYAKERVDLAKKHGLEIFTVAIIRECKYCNMARRLIRGLDRTDTSSDNSFLSSSRASIDFYLQSRPPRNKASLMRPDMHRESLRSLRTGKVHPQEFSFSIGERQAIVKID